MPGRPEFYAERHARSDDYLYAAASYDIAPLLRAGGLGSWLSSRRTVRILDVGCGRGRFLKEFSAAAVVAGVEVERAAGVDLIESTPNDFTELPNFEFVQHDVDGQVLPFADATFDFVVSNHVIEHLFETEHFVRELRRVVTASGRAVISAPNIAAWMNRLALLFGGQPLGSEVGTETTTYGFWPPQLKRKLAGYSPSGHIRDFTPGALRDLTAACGFRTIGYWPQDGGVLSRANPRLARDLGVVLQPV